MTLILLWRDCWHEYEILFEKMATARSYLWPINITAYTNNQIFTAWATLFLCVRVSVCLCDGIQPMWMNPSSYVDSGRASGGVAPSHICVTSLNSEFSRAQSAQQFTQGCRGNSWIAYHSQKYYCNVKSK